MMSISVNENKQYWPIMLQLSTATSMLVQFMTLVFLEVASPSMFVHQKWMSILVHIDDSGQLEIRRKTKYAILFDKARRGMKSRFHCFIAKGKSVDGCLTLVELHQKNTLSSDQMIVETFSEL